MPKIGPVIIVIYAFIILYLRVTANEQNILAFEGSPITLSCSLSPPKPEISTIKWFMKDNGIDLTDTQKYKTSTTLSIDQSISTNLRLLSPKRIESGIYTCYVKRKRQCVINLKVGYLEEHPDAHCSLLKLSNLTHTNYEDKNTTNQLNLLCTAFLGNNVFVNITIKKSVDNLPPTPVHYGYEKQTSAITGVRVNYPLSTKELNGWRFWCVAHHPMMSQDVNCSTSTLLKPVVDIVQVRQEEFICEAEAYPTILSFRWILCRKSEKKRILRVKDQDDGCKTMNSSERNLTLATNESAPGDFLLVCQVYNAVGMGQASFTIVQVRPTAKEEEPKDSNYSVVVVVVVVIVIILVIIYVYKRVLVKKQTQRNASSLATVTPSICDTGKTYVPDNNDTQQPIEDQLYATPQKKKKSTERYENAPIYYTLQKNDS